MRVLLAEPWFGGSHRSWAEGFAAASAIEVSIVGLPPTLWRWRLRAGAAPLADKIKAHIDQSRSWPDCLVVSGLVDVAALLGHLRPPSDLLVVTYMHESQLVYPTVDGRVDGDAVLRNWDSWLASDSVWFNSAYHRNAVVEALPAWVAAQPEPIPSAVVDSVIGRFEVHPVGVNPPGGVRGTPGRTPVILWPHRWEPDKAPDVFARAIDKLAVSGIEFELILAGEDPARSESRQSIVESHGERVLAAGPFPRAEYEELLHRADVVVSCAEHEFFGIAVVEAMMAGCIPVLPDDLSYPEVVPEPFRESVLYPPGSFGSALREVMTQLGERRTAIEGLGEACAPLEWASVAIGYDRRLRELALGSTPC
jgi:glycosyltransferase involved in cell wall biosynthesis